MDVAPSGLDADFPDAGKGSVPHELVFLVRKGHGRSNCNGIPRVHAHGIEIFDRTNDHALVLVIAHHLHLVLFPPQQALFHQNLTDRGCIQALAKHLVEFLTVVGNASTGSPQSVSRTQNNGEIPQIRQLVPSLLKRMHGEGKSYVQADLHHGLLEQFPVFALLDRIRLGSDHLDIMIIQDTRGK